eukprot:m.221784 g.221784  ORF g.221784 m.221784 type:complete len:445 (-) comp32126_c0_seq1:108-1442(-)
MRSAAGLARPSVRCWAQRPWAHTAHKMHAAPVMTAASQCWKRAASSMPSIHTGHSRRPVAVGGHSACRGTGHPLMQWDLAPTTWPMRMVHGVPSCHPFGGVHTRVFQLDHHSGCLVHSLPTACVPLRLNMMPHCMALSSSSPRDAYEILGVDRGATDKEIKIAYLQAAREVHPDVNDSPEATRRFQEVSDAYNAISTREKRARYAFEARTGSTASSSTSAGPDGPYERPHVDPSVVFNTVLEDLGVGTEIVRYYLEDLQDDMALVSEAVGRGEYAPLFDFISRRKGLFVATLLPLLVILRMPGLALGALSIIPRLGLTMLSAFARLPYRANAAVLQSVVLKYLDMQRALHRYADQQRGEREQRRRNESGRDPPDAHGGGGGTGTTQDDGNQNQTHTRSDQAGSTNAHDNDTRKDTTTRTTTSQSTSSSRRSGRARPSTNRTRRG